MSSSDRNREARMTSASPGEPGVPSPTPEQQRIVVGQFDRANQVVATGDYDYGVRLLQECCRIDPANLLYRQALRRAAKAKYRLAGSIRQQPLGRRRPGG